MTPRADDVSRPIAAVIRPPRILFVVNAAWFFLSHRSAIAVAAKRAGYEVFLAAGVCDESENEGLDRIGVPVHSVPINRGSISPVMELKTVLCIARVMRALRPDVVHNVTPKAVVYGGIVARLLSMPAVVNAVSGLGFAYSSPGIKAAILRRLVRPLYSLALGGRNHVTIVQNQDDLAEMQRGGKRRRSDKVVLIRGSGVDLNEFPFAELPTAIPMLLLPARMLRDKGVVEFCNAAQLIRQKGVEARFVLAGRADPENPSALSVAGLTKLCEQTGVEWIGHVDKIRPLMEASTIVCLPSYREGLPKALIEACAIGRPIVTTDVPGCREVVQSGVNGLLVPVRDTARLAAAMERLIGDRDECQKMGRAGRVVAEKEFDVRSVVESTIAIYDGLIRGPGLNPRGAEKMKC